MTIPSTTCKVCHLPIAELQTLLQRACPFCDRSFRRADAVRRHARTCPARANRPLPETKRGRKSRACDSCAHDKTSCDGALPCARCATRGCDCQYSSLCHDESHRGTDNDTYQATAGRDKRMTLSFLLEWSDPTRDPMLWMMESEPENRVRGLVQETALPGLSAWLAGTIDPALLLLDLPTNGFLEGAVDSSLGSENSTVPISVTVGRMQSLEAVFRSMLTAKPSLQHGFDLSFNNGFFTTTHIESALSTDSSRSSQLATSIHWPTFEDRKSVV